MVVIAVPTDISLEKAFTGFRTEIRSLFFTDYWSLLLCLMVLILVFLSPIACTESSYDTISVFCLLAKP